LLQGEQPVPLTQYVVVNPSFGSVFPKLSVGIEFYTH
jgi:hypothetical protein